jgi:predicted nucleic acid-binding Zn ribbon protein
MARRLFWLGVLLILATIALWVADTANLIQGSTDDRFWGLTLKAGVISLGLALLFRLLSPVQAMIQSGHCTVCGRPTERGHTYCLDHLQETVNRTRDQSRSQPIARPKVLR